VVSIIWNELKPGEKIALIALMIAFFSIFLGAYNAYETNRIVHTNIKPILHIHIEDLDEKESITLVNSGLGPAIITDMTFYKNNKELKDISALFERLPYSGEYVSTSFGGNGSYVQKDQEMSLAEITSEDLKQRNNSDSQIKDIMNAWIEDINGTQIFIAYEDILGEKQEPITGIIRVPSLYKPN
jgi:hypothetical protein